MKKMELILGLLLIVNCFFTLDAVAQDKKEITIEILAPSLAVFDAASQLFIERGYSIVSTNERIGLITTDYKNAKKTFGGSFVLALFGKEDLEIMLTTNIRMSGNTSILTILPKARARKTSRFKEEYDEVQLSKRALEGIAEIAKEIKKRVESKDEDLAVTEKTKELAANMKEDTEEYKEAMFLKIKVESANIRKEPSLQSEILKRVNKGSEFKVIGIEGEWYEVIVESGTTGYIHKTTGQEINVKVKNERPKIQAPPEEKPKLKEETQLVIREETIPQKRAEVKSEAQTEIISAQTSPIDKGSINIGGMLSFQSYSGDLYGDGMSTTLLMPGFRYFIMRGLAVGADLMLIRQSGDDWSDTTTGIGPTVAYFFNTKSEQFYPYVGLRLQYYCLSSSWNSHTDSMTGFDFGFGGGLAYMLKKNVAVTAELGYHIQSLSYEGESESGNVLSFMVGLAIFLY